MPRTDAAGDGAGSASWMPTATARTLELRARCLARVRAFFAARDVLEVETPLLSPAASTDPALESFRVAATGDGDRYLVTSPEFHMKRMLAAGSGSIYQLGRAFRAGECGNRHNPEFTLLEWYRVGMDHLALMDEVEALVREVLAGVREPGPALRFRYGDLFREFAGVDGLLAGADALRAAATGHGIDLSREGPAADCDFWRDLLLTHVVEPRLPRGMVFVHDYPASQCALARVTAGSPPVAQRFELYLDGMELANGFHELADAAEQQRRFAADLESRRRAGLPAMPVDTRLLAALAGGLPDCAGVALGIDRLVMSLAGATSIREVMAFPDDRA